MHSLGKRIFSVFFIVFFLSIFMSTSILAKQSKYYSQIVSVTAPIGPNGSLVPYAKIRVVKVHPHVSLHYFKKDNDPYMFLNHCLNSENIRYYNAILFPIIGWPSRRCWTMPSPCRG